MVGFQALSQAGIGAGDRRERLGIRGGLAGDGQPPGRALKVEVSLGNLEHRVVGRGPEPGLVGGQKRAAPPSARKSHQRSATSWSCRSPKGCRCRAAAPGSCSPTPPFRRRTARCGRSSGPGRSPSGSGRQTDTSSARRKVMAAKCSGLAQVGRGLEDALPGDRDIQVARTGKLERVGQVDRLDRPARDQRFRPADAAAEAAWRRVSHSGSIGGSGRYRNGVAGEGRGGLSSCRPGATSRFPAVRRSSDPSDEQLRRRDRRRTWRAPAREQVSGRWPGTRRTPDHQHHQR